MNYEIEGKHNRSKSSFVTSIPSLNDLLKTRIIKELILYDRVSRRGGHKLKLSHRAKSIIKRLSILNIKVIHILGERISGQISCMEDRTSLQEAIRLSLQLNIPILAPSRSRFLRSNLFNTISNPNAVPNEDETSQFLSFCDGVSLCVLSDDVLNPDQEKAFLAELAMETINQKRGPKKRGYKKEQKKQWLSYSIEMRKSGLSYRAIAEKIASVSSCSVTHMTIKNWIKSSSREASI